MDITPQDNTATQPISDDQELAKALAGVLPDEPEQPAPAAPPLNGNGLQFEETPGSAVSPVAAAVIPPVANTPVADPSVSTTSLSSVPEPVAASVVTEAPSELDSIKNDALKELRPLIDRVDLPAEEKFDTYLMLIRSTDDSSLIAPAHTAAQAIADEKRKAEALLDIIKEIDYLSRKDQ